MSNYDNKFNINNSRASYVPSMKKDDVAEVDVKQVKPQDAETSKVNEEALQQSEMYGRSIANRPLNPETVQCVKEAIAFYQNNPSLVNAAEKAIDDSCELGASYENACRGICDAAFAKVSQK